MPDQNSTRTPPAPGKVRWRRFALVAAPALTIAAVLGGATGEGALASSISVSGKEYIVAASQLTGSGFVEYPSAVQSDQGGRQVTQPVMVSGIQHATLSHLCQSVQIGPVTLRLTAGSGSTPASADNLIVDSTKQTGTIAIFHNIAIGQDAGTLSRDPGSRGMASAFGEQASTVTIDNLRQDTWLTTAGTFTLPGLSIAFGRGC